MLDKTVFWNLWGAVFQCMSEASEDFSMLFHTSRRICWPFEADQPAAAAHLTENLKVAFELIEVRTGDNGLKPLLRNGRKSKGSREAVGIEIRQVLDACRGQKGEELRKNAEAMKTKFKETWEANGVSRGKFQAFLDKYEIQLS